MISARGKPSPILRFGVTAVTALLLLFATLTLLPGCRHYHTGSLPQAHRITVFLAPTQNEAYISGFASLFQNELLESFRKSSVIILTEDEKSADYSMQVRLRNFNKQAIAYAESDTGQPASARYSIEAWVSLLDREKGSFLLENDLVNADISIYVDAAQSFTIPGFQSNPTLARDLATNVTRVIEYTTIP